MRLPKLLAFVGITILTTASAAMEIQPLPQTIEHNAAKADLGKQLFFDKRLSIDDTISCASCHNLSEWGAETHSVSTGVNQQLGTRNSPTVFNSVFNFKQYWDGRADSLSHQAEIPVTNGHEMGMLSWDDATKKISQDLHYQEHFSKIYGEPISKATITDAIAEFEKTLITVDAPFDRYLRGDKNAITPTQIKGFEKFKSYGCVACHQGRNVGGNMFQKFGVLKDLNLGKNNLADDLGRYTVTKNEWDKRVFKVPSLRLAVKTPPYFHNGSVETIEEAVDIMIKFQLGRDVPQEDRDDIIAFLESLVGIKPEGL